MNAALFFVLIACDAAGEVDVQRCYLRIQFEESQGH